MNHMYRAMRTSLVGLLILVFASTGGCVSTTPDRADGIHLTLTSVGTLMLDGKVVERSALPGALKSCGASPSTPIIVAIPANTSMKVVSALTSQLASAGYTRVAFTRPRHADAGPSSPAKR